MLLFDDKYTACDCMTPSSLHIHDMYGRCGGGISREHDVAMYKQRMVFVSQV
jgi:hypothetical protein